MTIAVDAASARLTWNAETAIEYGKTAIAAGLKLIPGVGSIAGPVASILLDLMFPKSALDVWEEIRTKVEALVDQKISENNIKLARNHLAGIAKNVGDYCWYVQNADPSDPKAMEAVRRHWTDARASLRQATPTFQDDGDAVPLLPLFCQLANFEILVLRDAIKHGSTWGLATIEIDKAKADIATAMGGGGTSKDNYIHWVQQTYQRGRSSILDKYPGTAHRARWNRATAITEYDRTYYITAVDWAKYLWPHADPVKNPDPVEVERTREVFAGPFGMVGNRKSAFYDEHVVREQPKHDKPITAVQVRSADRLDGLWVKYGDVWTSLMGGNGGTQQPAFEVTAANLEYLKRFWVHSHVGWATNVDGMYCYSLDRFGLATGHRESPWWGKGLYSGCRLGNDLELVEDKQDDVSFAEHRISSITVNGRGWSNLDYDASDCMFIGLAPVTNWIRPLVAFPSINGTYALVNKANGMFMDLESWSSAEDIPVCQWSRDSSWNPPTSQCWTLKDAENGLHRFENKYSGKFLGTRLYQGGRGTLSQRGMGGGGVSNWALTENTDGSFTISGADGRVASTPDNSEKGRWIEWNPPQHGDNERWYFLPVTNTSKLRQHIGTHKPRLTIHTVTQDRNYFRATVTITNPVGGEPVTDWRLNLGLPSDLGGDVGVDGGDGVNLIGLHSNRHGLCIVVQAADWSTKKTITAGDAFTFDVHGGAADPNGDIRDVAIKAVQGHLNGIAIEII